MVSEIRNIFEKEKTGSKLKVIKVLPRLATFFQLFGNHVLQRVWASDNPAAGPFFLVRSLGA